VAAAEAFLRGVERRIEAGLKPTVGSVASVFVSRWDAAVKGEVPAELTNRLGIAIAERTYKACRGLLGSPRWQRVYNAGAHGGDRVQERYAQEGRRELKTRGLIASDITVIASARNEDSA